jgi:hypothetical protein
MGQAANRNAEVILELSLTADFGFGANVHLTKTGGYFATTEVRARTALRLGSNVLLLCILALGVVGGWRSGRKGPWQRPRLSGQ